MEPEVYWPEKRAEREVRVKLENGQKCWCSPMELVKPRE
jgi:hypothetical protein